MDHIPLPHDIILIESLASVRVLEIGGVVIHFITITMYSHRGNEWWRYIQHRVYSLDVVEFAFLGKEHGGRYILGDFVRWIRGYTVNGNETTFDRLIPPLSIRSECIIRAHVLFNIFVDGCGARGIGHREERGAVRDFNSIGVVVDGQLVEYRWTLSR